MTHLSGKAGAVYSTATGATVYGATGMKSWTLDYVGEALERTDFGDSGHRTYIPGLDGWSGSFEGFKSGAPHILVNHTATIELRESAAATQKWTGKVIITGAHPTVDVDGVVGLSYDFQGTGVLKAPTG